MMPHPTPFGTVRNCGQTGKNMRSIVAISIIFLTLSAFADDGMEAFGKLMMTFYQSPSPEAFQRYQRDADRLEEALLKNDNGGDVLLAVAIARIAEKHGWPIEAKGTAGRRAQEILEGASDFAKYIKDDQQVNPSKLDVWWVSFFSTGDTSYLEKIFQYAGEPIPENDLQKALVIGAATWSFKSNCSQNEDVRAFAKQQLASATNPEKKAFLQKCIDPKNE